MGLCPVLPLICSIVDILAIHLALWNPVQPAWRVSNRLRFDTFAILNINNNICLTYAQRFAVCTCLTGCIIAIILQYYY
jgi:hypothetical protein